jgi:hypothetical protein
MPLLLRCRLCCLLAAAGHLLAHHRRPSSWEGHSSSQPRASSSAAMFQRPSTLLAFSHPSLTSQSTRIALNHVPYVHSHRTATAHVSGSCQGGQWPLCDSDAAARVAALTQQSRSGCSTARCKHSRHRAHNNAHTRPAFPYMWPWQHRLKAVHCWCGVVWAAEVQHCRAVVVALLTLGHELRQAATAGNTFT